MKLNKFTLTLVVLVSNTVLSQETIFKDTSNFLIKNKSELKGIDFNPLYYRDSILICHLRAKLRSNGRESLFMIDFSTGNVLEINQDDIKNKYLPSKGYLVKENKIIQLEEKFRDYGKNKYYIHVLNFENGKYTSKELDLDSKGEKIIGKLTGEKAFYLLSVIRKTSNLKIRTIDTNSAVQSLIVKNDKENFIVPSSIVDLKNFDSSGNLIENSNLPFDAEELKSQSKVYFKDETIYVTNDTKSKSYIYMIDSNTWEVETKIIVKNGFSEKSSEELVFMSSNSFLNQNILYQFIGNKKEFNLSLFDLEKDDFIFNKTIRETNPIFGLLCPNEKKEKTFKKKYRQILRYQNLGVYGKKSSNGFEFNMSGYSSGGTISFGPAGIGNNPAPIATGDLANSLKLYILKENNSIVLDKNNNNSKQEFESNRNSASKSLEINFKVNGIRYFGYYDINKSEYIINLMK